LAGLRIGVVAVLRAARIPWTCCAGRAARSHLPTLRSVLGRMAANFSDGRLDARCGPCWAASTRPRTANNYLSALKALLRESKRLGLLDPATFETLTDQPPVRGETLPAGRHVEADELELLFALAVYRGRRAVLVVVSPLDHAAVAQAHPMDRVRVLERLPQLLAARRYSS
jgi:hypothetical protein